MHWEGERDALPQRVNDHGCQAAAAKYQGRHRQSYVRHHSQRICASIVRANARAIHDGARVLKSYDIARAKDGNTNPQSVGATA